MPDDKEIIKLSYDIDKGNYMKDVYFEKETDTHILVYKDSKQIRSKWISKNLLRQWNKKREIPQNIYLKWCPPNFAWEIKFFSLDEMITFLNERFQLISVYGIGSYFDDNIPSNWIKNDIDLIIIVKNLDGIPFNEKMSARFIKKKIGVVEVFVGFNTIAGLNDKDQFHQESFANYGWALHELKLSENSKLLFGEDIRDQLPDLTEIQHDFEDMLPHILYHVEKSYEAENNSNEKEASSRFSKAVFKFTYYLCVLDNNDFLPTSTITSAKRVKELCSQGKLSQIMDRFIENCVIYRITHEFREDVKILRKDFITYVFTLAKEGALHRKFETKDLLNLLENTYGGFPNLIKILKKTSS